MQRMEAFLGVVGMIGMHIERQFMIDLKVLTATLERGLCRVGGFPWTDVWDRAGRGEG